MTQESNVLYTIKEKDFLDYARNWFKKDLANTERQIDNCLAKVQELKKAGDAYPQRALLPIYDIISFYKFDFTGIIDPDYDEGYYRDYIESDFVEETQLYTKNKDYCDPEPEINWNKTRIIYSDRPDDYDELPSADYLVSDEYNTFVASVVAYTLNAALAKSDLLSAAVISVCTERVEFEYDDPSDENGYRHAKDTVDVLLDKTPLFPDVQNDETNLKAKNREKVNNLITKLIQIELEEEKEKTLEQKQEAYELLKKTYPDHPEFADKLLS